MATKDKVALYGSHPFQEKAFQLVGKTRTREAAPGHHEAFISDPGNTSGRRHWNSETEGTMGNGNLRCLTAGPTMGPLQSSLGRSWR